MSTLVPHTTAPADALPVRRLRQFLALDAVITGSNGLAYLFVAGPLETLFAVPSDLLRSIGAFLIVFATALSVLAGRRNPPRVATTGIIIANLGWAAASLLALAIGALSPSLVGGVWVAAQAVVVCCFAAAQSWALRGVG